MILALAVLLAFVGLFFVVKVRSVNEELRLLQPVPPFKLESRVCQLLLVLSLTPLLLFAPWRFHDHTPLISDLASHAKTVQNIVDSGLSTGWIDSYAGGFPVALHYPPLGWLLATLGVKSGLSAALATFSVGWCALLLAPVVLYFTLTRSGLMPRYALVAACFFGWVSPYNPFVGGYEVLMTSGLLSQAVALPLCIWCAGAAFSSRLRFEPVLSAALAMTAHPQLAVGTIFFIAFAAITTGKWVVVVKVLRAELAGSVAAICVFGVGLLTLKVPFGWPLQMGWRQLGFPPERIFDWISEYSLLDRGRFASFTFMSVFSLFVLLFFIKKPSARAVFLSALLAVALSLSGRLLFGLGSLGHFFLSFLQPLRITSLVPPLLAVAVGLALQESESALHLLVQYLDKKRKLRIRSKLIVTLALPAISLSIALFGVPNRVNWLNELFAKVTEKEAGCEMSYPELKGYQRESVLRWLTELDKGVLWYGFEGTQFILSGCLAVDAIEPEYIHPVSSPGAVGAHVGVIADLSAQLEPERKGSAMRAEALGISYLLRLGSDSLPLGWELRHQRGQVQLWQRPGKRVGAACMTERWSGSDRKLRAALYEASAQQEEFDKLLDPRKLTELVETAAGWNQTHRALDGCDLQGSSVEMLRDETGLLEANVDSKHPVDVVFRVSAFPTWTLLVDGKPRSWTKVAPGYPAARLAPGHHVVTLVAAPYPGYRMGLLVGLFFLILLSCGPQPILKLRSVLKRGIGSLRRR